MNDPIKAAESIIQSRENDRIVEDRRDECLVTHDHTEGDCEFPGDDELPE